MDYFKLFLGILMLCIAITYLIYKLKSFQKERKGDYIIYSGYIKIFGAIFVFIMLGIILIYRELKHLL